ncbi:hypothetical protein [Streptomyces sp. NPDC087270]|uniref:hypothetical protein n=1 Tax=Streptomyces sp. NPDC087270 TaxID=3365774 RepID=UPI0038268460
MPYDPGPQPPLAAQADALRALLHIAEQHPELPGAYVVSRNVTPGGIDVQLDTPSAWEVWRGTLNVPANSATYRTFDNRQHLECVTAIGKTTVRMYSVFPHLDTDTSTGEPA